MPKTPASPSALARLWRRLYDRLGPFLWPNWLAMLGTAVSLACGALILAALIINLIAAALNQPLNPYFGLIAFMVLPGFFTLGAVLIVAGNVSHRRRLRRRPAAAGEPAFDPSAIGRRAILLGGATLASLVVLAAFSYQAYHYTDSTHFCSDVCHTVMEPEATAYQRSPHARVPCVSCHIGPGASWFVRAKLSGLRQVWAVATNSYATPIPTPVENLRPAQQTCEICHWPAKFHGSKLRVHLHFEPDRDNTPSTTALVVKVGGPERAAGPAHGVHWHVDPQHQVRYRHLDRERQDIVEVVQRTAAGELRYLRQDADPADTTGHWRTMDCVDCHNRPTHIYELPHEAVEAALAAGQLDRSVPWLRREAPRVLKEIEPGARTADRLAARLVEIYRAEHPGDLPALQGALPAAAPVLADILERNVFPKMKVTWGTYRSNLSHFDLDGEMSAGGCFRCHDENHATADGRAISQDCETCHTLLAEKERDPAALPAYVADIVGR